VHRPEAGAGVGDAELSGTTALVTGATGGVGRETALALGRLGARVLVHGRSRERGEAVAADLGATAGDGAFLAADFADLDAVRGLADRVAERVGRLDLLVNNAGTLIEEGELVGGVERTFLINHLAPFVLTTRLAPALPADGRVVTTASSVHRRVGPAWERVEDVAGYDAWDAYSRSKLANVCFALSLAERLDGPTANCFHPGFVPGSGLWRSVSLPYRVGLRLLSALPEAVARRLGTTASGGAETASYLAASPAVADATGGYFVDCERRTPSADARNPDARRRLWALSEALTGESL